VSGVAFAEKNARTPVETGAASGISSRGLRIGKPDDSFEREADRIADEVMTGGTPKRAWSFSSLSVGATAQRKCSCGGSSASSGPCEECKGEQAMQRKAFGQVESDAAPPIVHEVLNSPGHPLDKTTREFFEARFGLHFSGARADTERHAADPIGGEGNKPHTSKYDFSRVRIHTEPRAAASARAVNALAYTVGHDIAFSAGNYAPATREGRKLMAHELTHVVQQGAAATRPPATLQRQSTQGQGSAAKPCPTSAGLDTYRVFNHSNLPPTEQANFRTYLGMLVRHDLNPGPDHMGHCIQEELSTVSTNCPASVTSALSSCSKSDCLPVNRAGQDRATGMSLPSNRRSFLDLHRTTSTRSILEPTKTKSCQVICQQKYHCDSLGAPVLGVFRITRNFRADTFTPPGGTPQHITTGEVEKVESFGKGDFPQRTLPKGEEYA
jgi:hypothetical protein